MPSGQFNQLNRLTPTCITTFAELINAKGYKTDDGERHWNIQVRMSPETGAQFIAEIEEIALKLQEVERERLLLKKKRMRPGAPFIAFKNNNDGDYIINFKKKERMGNPPPVIDYNRTPIDRKIPVGTRVQVAYNLSPYTLVGTGMFGVSFQLIAVRVMEQDLPSEEIQAVFCASKDNAILKNEPQENINLDDLF